MIKCPNCNQSTRDDLDKCQYCNSALPKDGPKGFLKNLFFFKTADPISMDPELKELVRTEEAVKAEFKMVVIDVLDEEPWAISVRIESGIVRIGDIVFFISKKGQKINAQVGLIIKQGKYPKQAVAGEQVDIGFGDKFSKVKKEDIGPGTVIAK